MGWFNNLEKKLGVDEESATLRFQKEHDKKQYCGAHVKNAILNMISTDNLDAVFNGCAPRLSNKIYGNSDKLDTLLESQAKIEQYDQLQGRYEELQKHYDELKAERDSLLKLLGKAQ